MIMLGVLNVEIHQERRKMITKLTKEQESQIPKFIDKWINQASTPKGERNVSD